MVSAISFGWFAEFGKTLPLFNARPNRFILTNGKYPRCLCPVGDLINGVPLHFHLILFLFFIALIFVKIIPTDHDQ